MRAASHKPKSWHTAPLAALLVLWLLFLNALAASPRLHEEFHADAGSTQHQCAVTLFAHGQVDSASVEVAATIPPSLIEFSLPSFRSEKVSTVQLLPAGRAPPASFSNS